MPRTIVYYTDSAQFGGAEQVLLTLLAGLDRARWRPLLMYHEAPGLRPLLEGASDLGVRLRAVPPMPDGVKGLRHLPGFVREVRDMRPAVFHANLTWPLACRYALLGAALARVPAVAATVHLYVDLPYGRAVVAKQRLLNLGVDRYIAVSREVARCLQGTFAVAPRKISVVHNGVPRSMFARPVDPTLRASLTGRPDLPLVLTVARLDAQKGHRFLLEAAGQLPDVMFALAGDGPERTGLEAEASRLGISDRVLFLGHRTDVADLMASCDLFALPSLYEGLPLSILEAMAASKPVVATRVGGTPEAITNGQTGLLVPPGDPQALASAIREVLCDPSLARRLGEQGQVRARREFSAQTMVARTVAVYDRLLRARGRL